MSGIIVPESCKPAFIAGRRLKRVEHLEEFLGCVIVLRNPSERSKGVAPTLPTTKACGVFQTVLLSALARKRATAMVVMSPAAPGAIVPIPVEVLEESNPWCHPPGMPERAVSMLEG